MKKNNTKGTTLVEVTVSSMLLLSVIGLITLALAAVFEGYAMTQERSVIDQDGQYILARLKYISSQQDSQTIYAQIKSADFSKSGSTLSNLEQSPSEDGGIYLGDPALGGEYTSPIISLTNASLARYFVASAKRPEGTEIKYRLAMTNPVDGSCENATYTYIGEGGVTSAFFTNDYFLIPKDDDESGFENPATCLRYKAYLSSANNQTPVLYSVIIQR